MSGDCEWISWLSSNASRMFECNYWPKLVFRSSLQRSNCQSKSCLVTKCKQSAHRLPQNSVLLTLIIKSLLFINLFLIPITSHAFRVPYRYPHYPLFHKELINNSPIAGPAPNEVVSVELFPRDNAKTHHTSQYEIVNNINPSLVIRRGDPFYLALRLNGPYDQSRDKIRLEFMFGPRPQIGKGTLIYLPISNNKDFTKDSSKWDARSHHIDGNQLTIHVHLPANVAVGIWKLRVSTKQQGSRNIRSFDVKENIYVLFNAWNKDDGVFLPDDTKRREYVLNDVGKIYIGSHSKPKGRQWIYGQFADSVLPAVMFMMEKTRLDYSARANPVKVVRSVAAMVNSHDDNGLLVGNWSGNYNDGNAPWQWTGSAPIFEQYLRSNGEPIKFGQCWVFAGSTTTMSRALGIPARTITNFVSAHDTDDSLTVDKFFTKDGEPISDVNSDSIWNFHVWTDVWMSRPDLPPGYGGWQVIDATPQESSDVSGLYQTGPASLEAIRKGEVGMAYDVPFVFAEVNSDVVHWQLDETSELGWRKIKTNKYHVGRKLFTKRVGVDSDYGGISDAEDITALYKFKEGTEEERMAVLNAARGAGLSFLFELPQPGKEDIEFDLLDIEKVIIGNPFYIQVEMTNRVGSVRTVTLSLSCNSFYLTGILARKIKQDRQIIVLQPYQKEVFRIRVNSDDYIDKLVDYSMMKIYAIATVKETQQTWSEEDDFSIEKPQLHINTRGDIVVGREYGLEIQMTNPINRVLTDCAFTIEGPGITRPMQIKFRDIQPGESIAHSLRFVPQRPGPRTIVVVFHSRQLIDVVGSKPVNVIA
ncbi:hemocyte protein-glutamine gamma-glutamyltransferase-like [Oppia nitens]|uniref:hemocyte protein-glutamine gamma-glutamyltransferase-like n=1 Tax=Oppia nitens TaxID=1686743 RepID=UPI0023D9CBAD|nr:hemocyte protein-glutamine gamma-glutamyltransferase-like [Oppia nitens]